MPPSGDKHDYSIGNLDGLMLLARLGENVRVDLWNFETPDGRGIQKALDFLLPLPPGDRKWPYQQWAGSRRERSPQCSVGRR